MYYKIALFLSFQLATVWRLPAVESKCSRLPSGNCWVNCMNEIYDVICNGVTSSMLQSDINVFARSPQMIRLYIWSSPKIKRISADVFSSVAAQIVALDLQDLENLDTLPELFDLTNLELLNIWNSPGISDFATELLPPNVKQLSINKIGFDYLLHDFSDFVHFPKVELLVLGNMSLRGWQDGIFKVFPNVRQLRISNSTFGLTNENKEFPEITTIFNLTVSYNNFSLNQPNRSTDFLAALARSFKVQVGGFVDLSYNNISISDDVLRAMDNFAAAASLSLRGNPIVARPEMLSGYFEKFVNLQFLDLGDTKLLPVADMFKGLPGLQTLNIDNNFLNSTDMDYEGSFQGFLASGLISLDCSFCQWELLPTGIPPGSLEILNLRGNLLQNHLEDDLTMTLNFGAFKALRSLDISSNNFTYFRGTNLKDLTALDFLDMSCNPFDRITKEYFDGLPKSLRTLDISMCRQGSKAPPVVNIDAFSTLPPIRRFSMNKAALKKGIFSALNASAHALTNLRELYLQDNKFTYIARSNIPHLPNLELLDIRRNHLQSITQLAFGNLPGLKSLILAENRISSIGSDNLGHNHGSLQQLEVLNLERNNITRIDPKAFDNLPRLKSLLLGWNEADVQSLFMGGESELMYLGIQQDHNQSCIKPLLYSKLKKLRWLMPDAYNLILLRPDASLLERDPYLLSLVKHCHPGTVITNRETYGLRDFAGVTIHDADDEGLNYPVQIAFLPLTYCPEAAYINTLSSLICSSSSSSSGLH